MFVSDSQLYLEERDNVIHASLECPLVRRTAMIDLARVYTDSSDNSIGQRLRDSEAALHNLIESGRPPRFSGGLGHTETCGLLSSFSNMAATQPIRFVPEHGPWIPSVSWHYLFYRPGEHPRINQS